MCISPEGKEGRVVDLPQATVARRQVSRQTELLLPSLPGERGGWRVPRLPGEGVCEGWDARNTSKVVLLSQPLLSRRREADT